MLCLGGEYTAEGNEEISGLQVKMTVNLIFYA